MIRNEGENYLVNGDRIVTCADEVLMWLSEEDQMVLILKNMC